MQRLLYSLVSIIVLGLSYLLGPRPQFEAINPNMDKERKFSSPEEAERAVQEKESGIANMRPNNHARIIWADSNKRKTPHSMVFFHGFSASPMCGEPTISTIAKRYGCNLYLARLPLHGIGHKDAFNGMTPKMLIDSAKYDINIAKALGEKVIILGSSTGCTIAAYLAAHNPEGIAGLMFYSPNFDLNSYMSYLLTKPWGNQLTKAFLGDYRSIPNLPKKAEQYWTKRYKAEAVVALRKLMDETMTQEVFEQIDLPVMLGYYYKNDKECDKVISVSAIKQFYDTIATPEDKKRKVTFPDAKAHVVLSSLRNMEVEDVQEKSFAFAEEVLDLKPAN